MIVGNAKATSEITAKTREEKPRPVREARKPIDNGPIARAVRRLPCDRMAANFETRIRADRTRELSTGGSDIAKCILREHLDHSGNVKPLSGREFD